MVKTTCQVCEREIKAKTGLIAHHGYKRPGHGYQTASCMGAKHLPYEVSCDVLPRAMAAFMDYVEQRTADLKALLESPPESITVSGRNLGYRTQPDVTYTRPADFTGNPDAIRCSHPRTYENAFRNLVTTAKMDIHATAPEVARLQKRLADWKAPA